MESHPTQRQRHLIVDNPFALLDLKLAAVSNQSDGLPSYQA
jgi:hypothetical protein